MTELKGTVADLRGLVDAHRRRGASRARRLRRHRDAGERPPRPSSRRRSTSLDKAIDGATTTLASVDSAATSFDTLVDGDGTALVAEARTTLASIQVVGEPIEKAATDDLPAIIAEVRRR